MVDLIVVDVGDTLGEFARPFTPDVLSKFSPLPIPHIAEETRRFLHTAPELTEEVIVGLCKAILMDPRDWPDPWPETGFDLYPYTLDVLARFAEIAPVVALSNVPVTADQGRMREVADQCDPYLADVVTSYTMGMRKPDDRLWHQLCERYDVDPGDVVHVGDQWVADVLGAVYAGCRAMYVDTRRCGTPPLAEWPFGSRLAVGNDLRDSLAAVRAWHGQDTGCRHAG